MSNYILRSLILLLIASVNFITPATGQNQTINDKGITSSGDSQQSLPGEAVLVANSGSPLCPPAFPVHYWVYISGCPGPYTITMTIKSQVVTVTATVSPYEFDVNPSSTVILWSVTAPGCGNINIVMPNIITIQVLPNTTAAISGNTQICTGGSGTNLSVAFSGNGPFTFTYRINGVIQPAITTSTNPYFLHVNPSVTTTYQLNDVFSPLCQGTVSLTPVTVTVISPPGATLSGDMAFCNRADTALLVDFTGTGPYQLVYAIDSITQPPVTTSNDPYLIPVHTDTTAIYTLISVQNPGCTVPVVGQDTITVLSTPVDSNLLIHCNPVDNNYTVEFDIFNASPPITIVSGAGTLTGTHFTSAPVHQSQPYEFVYHDSINCQHVTVSGPSVCFCVSNADTMAIPDTLRACTGNFITAIYDGSPILDSDDSLRFILHTEPGSIGQILGWSDTPSFGFLPGMHADTVYYISAIAGDFKGNDSIDLADICLSIAPGTPVMYYALPQASFGSDTTICAGMPVQLPVTLSGTPPWSLQFAVNGMVHSTINTIYNSPIELLLNLADTSLVTLIAVSDQHCSNQPVGTVAVTVNFVPQIVNLSYNCDAFTTTYSVSFEIEGGIAPWTISGTGGNLNGVQFTSISIPSGQLYDFSLSDQNNCGFSQVSDVFTCPCATSAGSMDPTVIKLCPGEVAHGVHDNTQYLDSTDELAFVLHTNQGPGLGTVIAASPSPDFSFDPALMQYGVTYYIAAVAGNTISGGGVDVTEQCLSISTGTPVVWNEAPTANMSGVYDVCPGQAQDLNIVFTGEAPYTFEYTVNGIPESIVASTDIYPLPTTLFQSAVFIPVSVQDANCPGTVSGQVDVTVHDVPEITNPVQFCNPDNLHYSVSFDIIHGDPSTTAIVSGLPGTFDSVSGHFLSTEGFLPNSYTFIATDTWHCGADTLVVVPECVCVTNAGTMGAGMLKLCPGDAAIAQFNPTMVLDNTDTLVFVLHTGSGPGLGTILAVSPVPTFNFDPASMQYGVIYYISAAAANKASGGGIDWFDPCLSITTAMPVVWNIAPTATMAGDFDICAGQLQVLDIVFTGEAPYTLDYTENGILQTVTATTNTYLLDTELFQSGTFLLVEIADANCPGTVSGHADITVHGIPEISNPVQVCNPDNLHFSLSFDVQYGDSSSVNVTGLTGIFEPLTGHFTSMEADLSNTYTVVVSDAWQCGQDELDWAPDCGCETDAGQINQAPLDICYGSDIQFQNAGGQVLDGFDNAQYVLCTDPANLPQSILFQSTTPQFPFSPTLQSGTTYYIVAMAGNPLAGNGIDFNDPCLSVSPAIPVAIHALPTASIAGDTMLCRGGEFAFPVLLTGSAPFMFDFTLNSVPQGTLTTNLNTFPIVVHNIQLEHVFQLQNVQDQYCTGLATGTFTLGVQELPVVTLSGNDSICPGGSAILDVGLQNATLCNFDLVSVPGGSLHFNIAGNGLQIPVSPVQTTIYSINNLKVDDNGCSPVNNGSAKVDLAPVSVSAVAGNYNGLGISCFGANDGFAGATISGGFDPVELQWSNSDTGPAISNLAPGLYVATVTDLEGCTDTAEVIISEPEPLTATWNAVDKDCRPGSSGAVLLTGVQDGVGPYRVQANNLPEIPVDTLPKTIHGLSTGPVEIVITDANGCHISYTGTIHDPAPLSVDIGPDLTLIPGDSVQLTGVVTGNQPVSLFWTPEDGLLTPAQLTTWVFPLRTMIYSLTVEDSAGCIAMDEVLVRVEKTRRVYIPNVIKPEAGGDNAVFTVYGGREVKQVNYMSVYDRWGEHLFEARDFLPNNPGTGWSGMYKNKPMPPGVYVYVLEIAFTDGTLEVYKGSVTVVR